MGVGSKEVSRPEILIGHTSGEHVLIRVLGRMHPEATDFWDGNWLISPIELAIGDFRAEIGAGLRADELAQFRKGLEKINISLHGEAVLESMEGWLRLQVEIDRVGGLRVRGKVNDRPGGNNTLSFCIEDDLDQIHLRDWISCLFRAEAAFPVLGRAD